MLLGFTVGFSWVNSMSYEHYIGVIDEKSVLAECGPMRLVICAWKKDQPQLNMALKAAEKSFTYLQRIAKHRTLLCRPPNAVRVPPLDALALQMVKSVRRIGDDDLTPIAAVAGTIADAVADWLFERGMTKVVVDNGGDVSIRLTGDETACVGIRPSVISQYISHIVRLNAERRAWGITTSGFGGRSLTRGIASAVTTLAENASVADAASTAIANACFVENENIRQMPAEEVDPHTDLGGIPVTVRIGELSWIDLKTALDRALYRAKELVARGVIFGAFICQERNFVMTSSLKAFVSRFNTRLNLLGEEPPGRS